LAYLSDIFEVLNNFKLSFPGANRTEFILKLEAFARKYDFWA